MGSAPGSVVMVLDMLAVVILAIFMDPCRCSRARNESHISQEFLFLQASGAAPQASAQYWVVDGHGQECGVESRALLPMLVGCVVPMWVLMWGCLAGRGW